MSIIDLIRGRKSEVKQSVEADYWRLLIVAERGGLTDEQTARLVELSRDKDDVRLADDLEAVREGLRLRDEAEGKERLSAEMDAAAKRLIPLLAKLERLQAEVAAAQLEAEAVERRYGWASDAQARLGRLPASLREALTR